MNQSMQNEQKKKKNWTFTRPAWYLAEYTDHYNFTLAPLISSCSSDHKHYSKTLEVHAVRWKLACVLFMNHRSILSGLFCLSIPFQVRKSIRYHCSGDLSGVHPWHRMSLQVTNKGRRGEENGMNALKK